MSNITHLEPYAMVVFFSCDVDPGFYAKLCNDGSLLDTVHGGMFMKEQDAETREEVAGIVQVLRESGHMAFEDGWIDLRIGMSDVTAFIMEKMKEAKDEERFADKQRYDEMKRREETEGRYELLRQALADALGPRARDIAAKAAA